MVSVAPDDTRLGPDLHPTRGRLTESAAWAILAGRATRLALVRAPTDPLPRHTDAPAAPAPSAVERTTHHETVGVRLAHPTTKGSHAPCSTAPPSADPADPSRSPGARPTAVACAADRLPTTAPTAEQTAAPPTSSWILAPASPAARSAGSAARSRRHRPTRRDGRDAAARRHHPTRPMLTRRLRRQIQTWTVVVDGSWITGQGPGKLVDRSLAPTGTAGRSSGQPEGAEEFGSLDRRKAVGPIARWAGLSARGAAPPAREAGDPPADSSSATMMGTPSARTDGEPQGAPELPQGGRAPQGAAMDGRSDGPFGLLRARRLAWRGRRRARRTAGV